MKKTIMGFGLLLVMSPTHAQNEITSGRVQRELRDIGNNSRFLKDQVRAEKEKKEKLFLVNLRNRDEINNGQSLKLAPSLLAIKDANGILMGNDEWGRPVISIPAGNKEKLEKSSAVRSIGGGAPKNYRLIKQLTLRYKDGNVPTADDLKELGLKLIRDYKKGSFLIVEPLNGRIDAELADKLESNSKVLSVNPLFNVKAVAD